jgi:hypothetical protein
VLEFDLLVGQAAYKNIEFSQYRDLSEPTPIAVVIRNRSNQPASYVFISVYLDRRLKVADVGGFGIMPETKFSEHDVRTHLLRQIGVPDFFPIFREMDYPLGSFLFTISDRLLGHRFGIGYQLRAPGCFSENHGFLEIGESGQMKITMPPN